MLLLLVIFVYPFHFLNNNCAFIGQCRAFVCTIFGISTCPKIWQELVRFWESFDKRWHPWEKTRALQRSFDACHPGRTTKQALQPFPSYLSSSTLRTRYYNLLSSEHVVLHCQNITFSTIYGDESLYMWFLHLCSISQGRIISGPSKIRLDYFLILSPLY